MSQVEYKVVREASFRLLKGYATGWRTGNKIPFKTRSRCGTTNSGIELGVFLRCQKKKKRDKKDNDFCFDVLTLWGGNYRNEA